MALKYILVLSYRSDEAHVEVIASQNILPRKGDLIALSYSDDKEEWMLFLKVRAVRHFPGVPHQKKAKGVLPEVRMELRPGDLARIATLRKVVSPSNPYSLGKWSVTGTMFGS